MAPHDWESFGKLPHDVTLTMEQAIGELCVHGRTSVGWHLPQQPPSSALLGGTLYLKPILVSKSGSDCVRGLGKLWKAAS